MLTLYNDDISKKIRTEYLKGQKIKDIQAILGINPATWDSWYYNDTKGFRGFMNEVELEYMKRIARQNLLDVALMDIKDNEDVRYLKIKADVSQFIAETVDKENFSKRQEDNKNDRTPINIAINSYKRIKDIKRTLPPPSKPTLDK
jgi:hypothetical protein